MLTGVALPSDIALMHLTLIARPFQREGWVYEETYDEWRILGLKSGGKSNPSVGMVVTMHGASVRW
jgi:hypothetical protein